MPIIAGIDGTGPQTNGTYSAHFAHSFVHLICRAGKPRTLYRRGPGTASNTVVERSLGNALEYSIRMVVDFVRAQHAQAPNEPILLTGYSRGAAGVVEVARRLKGGQGILGSHPPIRVRALMLFDCVDRDLYIHTMRIPDNVGVVKHVMRSPSAASRESFNNSGLLYTSPTRYPPAERFQCTHGGMGGTWWLPTPAHWAIRGSMMGLAPTKVRAETLSDVVDEGLPDGKTRVTYRQDREVSLQVWRHVQPFLLEEGYMTTAESRAATATLNASH